MCYLWLFHVAIYIEMNLLSWHIVISWQPYCEPTCDDILHVPSHNHIMTWKYKGIMVNTYIISLGDNPAHLSTYWEQWKPWRSQQMRLCMCLKLTESMPRSRRCLLRTGHLYKGKISLPTMYVRNWGLKRGEGVCSKGIYFWEFTVPYSGKFSLVQIFE